jgi:hypothetical protein
MIWLFGEERPHATRRPSIRRLPATRHDGSLSTSRKLPQLLGKLSITASSLRPFIVGGSISIRPVPRLAQGQEPGQPSDDPGAGSRVVTVMIGMMTKALWL